MSRPVLEIAPDGWGDVSAAMDQAVSDGIVAGAMGIAIAAPEKVPLGSRDVLPLAGVRIATYAEALRSPLHAARIVAACIETGEILTAFATAEPAEPTEDDGADPGEGVTGATFQIDLFGPTVGLPKKPATWVVRVILHDQSSNAVTIALEPSRTRFYDPAADELVRELLRKPILRPLQPRPSLGPGLPSYERLPESPPALTEPGLTLKLKRAQLLDPKATLVMHGAFLAHVLPRDVRPPPTADTEKMRGPRATAVVPMMLLAMGSKGRSAVITPLVIPCYQPLNGEGDAITGAGAFAFDYFQLTPVADQAQTIFFYAFAGALMSNVAPCALVDPSALHA